MWQENLATLVSAWLFFLVMNAGDLETLVKNKDQRTPGERLQVKQGLSRIFCVEMFVLVPASAGLLLLVIPFFTRTVDVLGALASGSERERIALHAMMGIISYGFPFAALRERIANAMQAALTASTPRAPRAVAASGEAANEEE